MNPEASRSETKRCAASRQDGSPCSAFVLPNSLFCFAHDPERKAQRQEAHCKGGRNSSKRVRMRGLIPPRMQSLFDKLEAALNSVEKGTLDPRKATAMAAVARVMIDCFEAGEIEERFRRIEAMIDGKGKSA